MDLATGLDGRDRAGKFYQALCESLLAFAEQAFRDSRKIDGSGGTEADHAEVAAAVFANLPGAVRKVEAPIAASAELPAGAEYLWNWFCQLSIGLSAGGFAPAVVTWESLAAWRGQMGLELDPWECLALVRLGQLRAQVQLEDQPKA